MKKGFFKSKKSKVLLIVLIVIIVLVALIARACGNMADSMADSTTFVEVQKAEVRDLSQYISVTGNAEGVSKTNVTSKAAAEVTAVNVSVGDEVTAGDVLAALDSSSISSQISSAKTTISNQQAITQNTYGQNQRALEQAQEDYNAASNQLAADRAVLDSKNATLATLDPASEEYAALAAEIESIKATVASEQSALTPLSRAVESAQNVVDMEKYQSTDNSASTTLDGLKEQLADCELKAPISGVVTAVNVSVGDSNTPGNVLFTIEDTSTMKITATIDEKDILKVNEGQEVVITSNALGDEKLSGVVSKVIKVKSASAAGTDASSAQAGTGGYSAEITILSDSDLLVGMSTKAKIIVSQRDSALAVPYDLVKYDDNGDAYILVPEDNGDGTYTAKRCNITVGEEVDYYTEVLGGDLKAGDYFIYDYSVEEGDIVYCDLASADAVQGTEALDGTEALGGTGETGSTESVIGESAVDSTESVNSTEAADSTDETDSADKADKTDSADKADSKDKSTSTENKEEATE